MKQVVTEPMEVILKYKFNNKDLLIESLTHRSFKDAHNLQDCYEKLEVLGDAILDYIVNSNVMDFTIFDRYNILERQDQKYYTQEDF
jgi:ribonuclease-3